MILLFLFCSFFVERGRRRMGKRRGGRRDCVLPIPVPHLPKVPLLAPTISRVPQVHYHLWIKINGRSLPLSLCILCSKE